MLRSYKLRLLMLAAALLCLVLTFFQILAHDKTNLLSVSTLFRHDLTHENYKPERDPPLGVAAPSLRARNENGQILTNETFVGKRLRLLLVAECTPCIKKTLVTWNREANQPGAPATYVVSIGGQLGDIHRYMTNNNLNLNVLVDDNGRTGRAFNAAWMPRAYFVESDGVLRYVQSATENDETALSRMRTFVYYQESKQK